MIRRARAWRCRNRLVVIGAICLGATVATQRSAIPTGGPIPDRRGFNFRVNDPKAVAEVQVIIRHVAGTVYVVAGAGGNIAVQGGDDGLLLVDNNFSVFYDQIMASIRQVSDKPIPSNVASKGGTASEVSAPR